MPTCKITVLKRVLNQDLADQYCKSEVTLCSGFSAGQEFIIEYGDLPPDGFCDWAWNDIYPAYLALVKGSDFSPWMKEGNSMIRCCSDGVRPVIFMLERISD